MAVTPSWRPRRRHWLLGAALALVLAAGLALWNGVSLTLPRALIDRVETRASASLGGTRLTIGDVGIALGGIEGPGIRLSNVTLLDRAGLALVDLGAVDVRLAARPLLRGDLQPVALNVIGGEATLRRAEDGSLSLALGGAARRRTPAEILAAIEGIFAHGSLGRLDEVTGLGLTITLEDARSGRIWQATGGRLRLERKAGQVTLDIEADLFNGTDDLAGIRLALVTDAATESARISFTVRDMPAADIALQSPALGFLGVLDAPISGTLRGEVGATGALASLTGLLRIGAGALWPEAGAAPVPFDGGRAHFTYDPSRGAIRFDEVSVRAGPADVAISGLALLRDPVRGWPSTLQGQFRLDRLALADGGGAMRRMGVDGGVTLRLRFDPFRLDLAEAHLGEGARMLRASGRVAADDTGWTVAVDAATDALPITTTLAAWPVEFAPRTRDWFVKNLTAGTLHDLAAAVRQRPGAPLAIGITADFDGGRLHFLRDMPPLEDAAGHLAYEDGRLTVFVAEGRLQAEGFGPIDAAGTVVRLPDLTARPAQLRVDVQGSGAIPDVLALLEGEPVRLTEGTGRGPRLAQGQASVEGRVALPLSRPVPRDEVDYAFDATLRGVTSEVLVPGRMLEAERLTLAVTRGSLTIAGPVRLDGVPATVRWHQPLGQGASGATVTGTVALSPQGLEAFGIGLGAVEVSGRGSGRITIRLEKGAAPRLHLESDLAGLGLALPAIGWSKPATTEGELALDVTLGPAPAVEHLAISAAGLSAEGRVRLAEGGGLASAEFDRVQIGRWFDAPVSLEGRPGAPPAISVPGGTVDLRARPPAGNRPAGGGGAPLSLALDRLAVAGQIAIEPFVAELSTAGGLSGAFHGRLGTVPVEGSLAPAPGGTAVRLTAEDAGAALAAAGVFGSMAGGSLALALEPAGAPGTYAGRLSIRGTRLRDAPAMAELLDAISIVGLLDELNGSGIAFDRVDASFRIESGRVVIESLAATGASMGLSLDGVYDLASKTVDLRGVISPVYLINGIGAFLSRPGEGVFGIAFALTGPASAPRVQVNPLSVFAPGALRDLFRRPPPAATE